ncbi:hypothetical protein ACOT81_31655 [Streptomyces sp. WI04-05B]|uniref:hypothetical protein n=1 Tax=Streptomyces TaxID=1883 RepID=UPI0029A9244C|nr:MULTISPECIES: hypothetical protein [unclassified Streptomyces]MDX2542150.1 hypothetical protein [Streptomyces sp. WI04-05B]MDX2583982.1 hypothetical protein [Streptomyces sp. WI04-05A]
MAVDPIDPETFETKDPEDYEDYEGEDNATEFDVEAPADDAVEQHTDVTPQHDAPLTGENTDRASEADIAEQARVVKLDEDDYR